MGFGLGFLGEGYKAVRDGILFICCHIIYCPKLKSVKQHLLSLFLRVIVLGAAQLSDSGSWPLEKFWASCQLGLHHLKAELKVKDLVPSSHVCSLADLPVPPGCWTKGFRSLLAVDLRPSSVAMRAAQGSSQKDIWLPPERVTQEIETLTENTQVGNQFLTVCYNLILAVTYQQFFCKLLVTQTHLVHCGRGPHISVDTRRQGPVRVILEAGHHSGIVYIIRNFIMSCLSL